MKKVSLWTLFMTFFKIGALTFGGGYAMISVLESQVVDKHKWITTADLLDLIVIAEATPGVIAVNSASSVGYRTRGIKGTIIATLGVVLPSMIIISCLSFALDALEGNIWYQSAFAGINVAVLVLILNAFVKISSKLDRNWFSGVVLLVSACLALFTSFNVIYLIISGAVVGIIYCQLTHKKVVETLPLEHEQNPISQQSLLHDESLDVEDEGGQA